MNISFRNRKLEKCANKDGFSLKTFGPIRSKLYKQRIDDLRAANSLEETRYLPGKFHELTADRKGQWACNLDHPYRLIFEPHEDPIPENEDGQFIWCEIKGIEIIEIADYHK